MGERTDSLIPKHHQPHGHVDQPLAVVVLVLTAIGIIVMLSASAGISLDRTGFRPQSHVAYAAGFARRLLHV